MNLFLRNAEIKWMEMLNAISIPGGWQAIHFHINDLLEQYKSDYQIKIAINLINDLLKNFEGGLFLLSDSSIVVMCYGLEKPLQNKLIFQLRYLYMDDPLAYMPDGQENPDFCTVYDLRRDWKECFDLCTRRMAIAARRTRTVDRMVREQAKTAPPSSPVLMPTLTQEMLDTPAVITDSAAPRDLSVSRLALIEQDLNHADLSRVIRRQPICAAVPNAAMRKVFDELYIHIAHLRQILRSDVDFLSDRWLFKYLTHKLDDRMLAMIRQAPTRYMDSPVSLNLNVETLLSDVFTELDAVLKPAMKVSIVIEIPIVDVFADMTAFTVARKEVQRLGYRVCLDGVTAASFLQIDREKLGLDLVKMQWNADIESDLNTRENRMLAEAVQQCGSNRVILCRCDSRQAVEYGQALGVSLFQGRFIDSVINPNAKIAN